MFFGMFSAHVPQHSAILGPAQGGNSARCAGSELRFFTAQSAGDAIFRKCGR